MPSLEEAANAAKSSLAATLKTGVETLSQQQSVTLTRYLKLTLPLDGYVFWVNANLLTEAAVAASLGLMAMTSDSVTMSLTVSGSFHHQSDNQQEATATHTRNHIIFTAESEVAVFNAVAPDTLWVGEVAGMLYAFSSMANRYRQAGLFHYRGDSVQPSMRSQMIVTMADVVDRPLIVSNSVPIFMAINTALPVFPAYLVAPNISPPYAVVDVRDTKVLQAAAHHNDTRSQHVQDTVRITLYGLHNEAALDYVDSLVRLAVEGEQFGINNSPVVVDDKQSQREVAALAMKKHIDVEVNYYQRSAKQMAQQLITDAFITYEVK